MNGGKESEITVIARQPLSTDHELGGIAQMSVAGLLGLLAADQHVLDAEVLAVAEAIGVAAGLLTTHTGIPAAHQTARTIATGTYTGNGVEDRQVTVGFKCSLMIIAAKDGQTACDFFFLIPNRTLMAVATPAITEGITRLTLHASDGVDLCGGGSALYGNKNGVTYYYWAISE